MQPIDETNEIMKVQRVIDNLTDEFMNEHRVEFHRSCSGLTYDTISQDEFDVVQCVINIMKFAAAAQVFFASLRTYRQFNADEERVKDILLGIMSRCTIHLLGVKEHITSN